MDGADPESLKSWAEGRSLAWEPENTLPPGTERLRRGLGVGEHRSGLRIVKDSGVVVTDKERKRPERQTLGVCEGMLPGGLRGELGHHVYLTDQGKGLSEGEPRYLATVSTVVYSYLPLRARPVFHLEAGPATRSDVKSVASFGGTDADEMESPLDGIVPAPQGIEEAGGMRWVAFPAESPERIRRIGSGSTRFLDGLPEDRVAVEYECGTLAVWIRGRAVTDGHALDQLCRFASALAQDLTETAESSPAIELDQPLALPNPDAREKWVRDGADLIDWEQPPVSIVAAQERYKKDVTPRARRTGWSIYAIVGGAIFFFGVLIALVSLGFSILTDEFPLGLAIMVAAISVAGGALAANRIGLEAGQGAMDDRVGSSATPWGIEAFARGYAETSGLVREDHDELRRRLTVPIDGRPQIAWQGEIAPGNPGHLSVWIDATDSPNPPRFYLLAVTTANGESAPAGYEVEEKEGLRYLFQEVTSVQRATHRLDQLRTAVAT